VLQPQAMAVVPRIGTEFAGYRIEALLGRGGMSVVYRAENARLGNKVALKLLAEELAHDENFRERFVRESRTAATLNHPNIVTIYDAGDWDGVLYIAMRLVDTDLKAHIRREGPLPPDHALAVAAQVGSALDAAHARGLLHRDVKPANILLEPGEPDAPPIAYLADFGLTKHLESRSGITASGQFVGTIDYMAPEQIEGREVDSRTDVYSLGCVVFESLAGGSPFRRETEVAVLWAHMRDEPPPLTELRPDLPSEPNGVIARAMAKNPEDRYSTCHELVADLRRALAGVSTAQTRAATPADRAGTRVSPARAAPDDERPGPSRLRRWLISAVALLAAAALGAGAYGLLRDDPQVIAAEGTTLSPSDEILLGQIPRSIRGQCEPTEPLSPDFDSSIRCRPGTRAADRVDYNHAKSGNRMRSYFLRRAIGEQLVTPGLPVRPLGRCGPDSQALGDWTAVGEAGHSDRLRGGGADGRFMCYRRNGWAAVEWTDSRRDIYSVAYGRDLRRLFGWWRERAGPTA
jgi:serine/threonine protein kinase